MSAADAPAKTYTVLYRILLRILSTITASRALRLSSWVILMQRYLLSPREAGTTSLSSQLPSAAQGYLLPPSECILLAGLESPHRAQLRCPQFPLDSQADDDRWLCWRISLPWANGSHWWLKSARAYRSWPRSLLTAFWEIDSLIIIPFYAITNCLMGDE